MKGARTPEGNRIFGKGLHCYTSVVGILVCGWMLLFALAYPQTEDWLRAQIGGRCDASFVDGNVLFVGEGPNLRLFDVFDPAAPVPLGSLRLPDRPIAMNAQGNRCYVACGSAGLKIVDVSKRSMPALIGSYEPPGSAKGVMIADRPIGITAFCIINDRPGVPGALHVLRFEDYIVTPTQPLLIGGSDELLRSQDQPVTITQPLLVGSYEPLASPREVAVYGNTAFVANGANGLEILHIDDRAMTGTVVSRIGTFPTSSSAEGIASFSDKAIIIICTPQGLEFVNASIPQRLLSTGFHPMGGGAQDVFVYDNMLLASGMAGVDLLEMDDMTVTDTQVTLLGTAQTAGAPGLISADPVRGLLAVAEGENGFEAFNIANPLTPQWLHHHVLLGSPTGIYFDLSSRAVIIANSSGFLDVLDASNPSFPTEICSMSLTGSIPGDSEPRDLILTSHTLLVADAGHGLEVFNADNIVSPTHVVTFPTQGVAAGLFVEGDLAFVAEIGSAILEVVDVSNPTSPVFVGSYAGAGEGHSVFVADGFAYLAAGSGGLQLIDVSQPSSPVLHQGAFVPTVGEVLGVDHSDGLAYVAAGAGGLYILDMLDAMGDIIKGNHGTFGQTTAVQVRDRSAIVGTDGAGLVVIRVGDPGKPSMGDTYAIPGKIRDLCSFDHLTYAITDAYGLWVVEHRAAVWPTWDRYR